MRSHKTITITGRMLRRLEACSDGIFETAELLPAKVSTYPEDNIELASELIDAGHGNHVAWLADRAATVAIDASMTWPDNDYSIKSNGVRAMDFTPCTADVFIIAQWLAHAADYLLMMKGR